MPTSVPAVERAAAILDHLAANPRTLCALAEIAAATQIHRATCHSILTALSQQGLVYRDEREKRYGLGPRLLTLTSALRQQFPGSETAQLEIAALARELDVAAYISVRMGDEVIVLDMARSPRMADFVIGPGSRFPITPPFGILLYAWEPPAVIESWLDSVGETAEIDAYRAAVTAIRSRGYSIGSDAEIGINLNQMLERLAGSGEGPDRLEALLRIADFLRSGTPVLFGDRAAGPPPVKDLIAPIFDADGRVTMTLTLQGPPPGFIAPDSHTRSAKRLLAATRRVTSAAGGRMPDPSLTGA